MPALIPESGILPAFDTLLCGLWCLGASHFNRQQGALILPTRGIAPAKSAKVEALNGTHPHTTSLPGHISHGIVLFVSPVYSQTNCSAETALIFFLWRFTAQDINRNMAVWVLWLLVSLGITLAMTVILALSSPVRARSVTFHSSPASSLGLVSLSTASTPRPPMYRQLYESMVASIPAWSDRSGQLILWYNVVCVVLWSIYIIGQCALDAPSILADVAPSSMLASEIQIQANCIFAGENSITSFGQVSFA